MKVEYDPDAALLKFNFKLEDCPIDQQYTNLVASIKSLLSDSTIPELDKQTLVGLIKKKTGAVIDTKDDLVTVLDDLVKEGASLKSAYEKVDSDVERISAPMYTTTEDYSSTLESTDALSEAFGDHDAI